MKLKITKSDKKALLAALAVCGIGILFSILNVLGVDIYRKHTYTSVILPDAYRITDMKAKEHTSYSVNGDNTDYVYLITVKYEIDGTSYTDTLQILQGTHFATELHFFRGVVGQVARVPVSYTHLTLPTIYSV